MDNYEQQAKALRECARNDADCRNNCPYYNHDVCTDDLKLDAADAIEALLKENKELIEDHPEMVEADGHWEWRKPNGEVLLPKRGEWIGVSPMVDTVQCSVCGGQLFSAELETPYCPYCGAKMMEVQDG